MFTKKFKTVVRRFLFGFEQNPKEVDQTKPYYRKFYPDEKLPLYVWTYLVKDRAKFKCELCGSTDNLVSHHFSTSEKAQNIHLLKHGKCVCAYCHAVYYTQVNDKLKKRLSTVYGKEKGKEIFDKLLFYNAKGQVDKGIKELMKQYPDFLDKYMELENKQNKR